jgi:hypothetical protein
MAKLILRTVKRTPLSNDEVDTNFKIATSAGLTFPAVSAPTSGKVLPHNVYECSNNFTIDSNSDIAFILPAIIGIINTTDSDRKIYFGGAEIATLPGGETNTIHLFCIVPPTAAADDNTTISNVYKLS